VTTIRETGPHPNPGAPRAKKGHRGIGMEGFIARWYARNTAKSRERFRETAAVVAGQVASAGRILEVAPGPGYLAIELARLGAYRIVGLDISHSFVEIARRNAMEAGVAVTFEQGNASRMPFEANSFDFIVCCAAFKNFTEPVHALEEMHRVLRPGGKALIADLRPDASSEAIAAEVKKMNLSRFNSWLTKMTFKYMLVKRAYSQEQFRQMAASTSFKTCEIQAQPLGMSIWLTKARDDR
jgi:ubiquinone/menaquinone biosynthesis C-methylase UbiE